MNFSTNLQNLRKIHNLSQEQLAERLDVSRQAVSKWENGSSYPEMDKLLSICDMFSLNMDSLVTGEVKVEENIDTENKEMYEKHYNLFSKMITLGVFLILLGVTIMAPFESSTLKLGAIPLSAFTLTIFFILVTIAVGIFIYHGINYDSFKKDHPYLEDFYTKEEKRSFNKKFAVMISAGVGIILVAVTMLVTVEEIFNKDIENFPPVMMIFFALITVAVGILVYYGMQKGKYDIKDYNREYGLKENPKASLATKISGVIMLVATMIFLSLGFLWNLWHIAWVVYPLGGILCGIVFILLVDEN